MLLLDSRNSTFADSTNVNWDQGALPDSHSNGFWAVKVGEGDCNEFYKAIKSVHQRRKRASMDRETTWTDLLLQNFTFAKYFKESLAIKFLLWKKMEDPHKTTFKKRTLSFFTNPFLFASWGPPLSCFLSIISREPQLRSLFWVDPLSITIIMILVPSKLQIVWYNIMTHLKTRL